MVVKIILTNKFVDMNIFITFVDTLYAIITKSFICNDY